jgi:hypothetical protein
VRLEELGQLKNPMTLSATESATFRLVAKFVKKFSVFWGTRAITESLGLVSQGAVISQTTES